MAGSGPRASTRRVGTNQEEVRRHNLGTLLGLVHRTGGLSRAELTHQMGLNRSTIADLVRELEESGVVLQANPTRRGGEGAGRPSINVMPLPGSAFVLAVELGVGTTSVAKVGLGGSVLGRVSATMPSTDSVAVVEHLAGLLAAVLAEGAGTGRLAGICIAIPGVIASDPGIVRFAPNLGWTDVALVDLLRHRLGTDVPIRLGNDAALGALAEHTRGGSQTRGNLIFLSCDVGVGGGVIVDGVPLGGTSGYAGEVGHVHFGSGQEVCRCGNRGCWETEIGLHAVAAAAGCAPEEVGDVAVRLAGIDEPSDELRRLGRSLGRGLGGLVNIFNPEAIVLGGVLRRVWPLVREDALRSLADSSLSAPGGQVQIELPALNGDSVLVGASELGFEDLLADPIGVLNSAKPGLPVPELLAAARG